MCGTIRTNQVIKSIYLLCSVRPAYSVHSVYTFQDPLKAYEYKCIIRANITGQWWISAFNPGLKGFEYYYALDEIKSKLDIWEQIDLVSKLDAIRNITNPNQTEVEEYGKLLELIDYYVPLSHFNVIQFVSFIPKTERKDFLRELKLLEPENIINAANFRPQQLIRLYNNFKLKFSEEEEVNLVQKKKGYKRFCKTCKKRHFSDSQNTKIGFSLAC
ncbi:hypothetical protein CANINC_005024 [Pichia inconspicua]|uniref:Uncharacterized protein n=1 Tax=Pichia inconspicua TaxID=52247 RepID=A0A4T0WW46_9ASCO|nr:hypothetical protein CANINC_005024 [[Candida] inconspicua]